jgi:hypothetical protein
MGPWTGNGQDPDEDTKHNQNNNHRWNQEGVPVNPKEYREPHTPEAENRRPKDMQT